MIKMSNMITQDDENIKGQASTVSVPLIVVPHGAPVRPLLALLIIFLVLVFLQGAAKSGLLFHTK